MTELTIQLSDYTVKFYQNIANSVGIPLEQVLADALFKLAGELSLEAIHKTL